MTLRRKPAVRRHVARLAVVSLIGLGLVGLSGGAGNADTPGDLVPNLPSSSDCLPDLSNCLDPGANDPSGTPTPDPTDSATPTPTPTHHPGHPTGPICVPMPADLLKKLPADLIDQVPQLPTCLPECLSDSVMHLLNNLPQDTLDELIADIESTLGGLPACLESLLPSSPPTSEPPSENPPSHHRHHHHLPPINRHIPYHAGPAVPVGGSPDFTG